LIAQIKKRELSDPFGLLFPDTVKRQTISTPFFHRLLLGLELALSMSVRSRWMRKAKTTAISRNAAASHKIPKDTAYGFAQREGHGTGHNL